MKTLGTVRAPVNSSKAFWIALQSAEEGRLHWPIQPVTNLDPLFQSHEILHQLETDNL